MQTDILSIQDPQAMSRAVDLLHRGFLVAFPTDTVYGLGAVLDNPGAIEQLFIEKGRASTKAIAVLIGEPAELDKVSPSPNQMAKRLADRFWPGPLTLVVLRDPNLPPALSPLPTIGVRMPNHPETLRLLRLSGPLAVTSANLSGASNTTTAEEVYDQLTDRIPLILDGGRTPGGQPSTVVDCLGVRPSILRQGPIQLEELLAALS